MKNKLIICLLTLTIAFAGCGTNNAVNSNAESDDAIEQTSPVKVPSAETESEETEKSAPNTEEQLSEETEQIRPSETENTESDIASTEITTQESETTGESEAARVIQTGSYNIDGIDFSFRTSVRNDVTGNWRVSIISTSATPDTYALDYYNTLFSSDSEVHAIINTALNTTTRINSVYGALDVTVLEHIDGEENDAKELFCGSVLSEYLIYTDTGKVEKIQ